MSEYKPYSLTLIKAPPAERSRFRALSRPETYFEIKKGEVGERVSYRVEMTEVEYEQALEDAEDSDTNLIVVEPDHWAPQPSSVPGEAALFYVAAQNSSLDGSGVYFGIADGGVSSTLASMYASQIVDSKTIQADGGTALNSVSLHGSKQFGVAVPPGATVAVCKIADSADTTNATVTAAGINWLADEAGVDVILVEAQHNGITSLVDAAKNAIAKNIVVVAAAGNGGPDFLGPGEAWIAFPAAVPGVLAISNYDYASDTIESTSNFGDGSAVGPGEIWAAATGDVYWYLPSGNIDSTTDGGTSAASALAARVMVMMMTGRNSPGNAVSYLASTARKTGASPIYEGNGVLQLEAASNELEGDQPPSADLNGNPTGGNDGTAAGGSGGAGACD